MVSFRADRLPFFTIAVDFCAELARLGSGGRIKDNDINATVTKTTDRREALKDEIDFISAAINHMGWLIKLEHQGRDLYPQLREQFEDKA